LFEGGKNEPEGEARKPEGLAVCEYGESIGPGVLLMLPGETTSSEDTMEENKDETAAERDGV
jgi:hypothetical protein